MTRAGVQLRRPEGAGLQKLALVATVAIVWGCAGIGRRVEIPAGLVGPPAAPAFNDRAFGYHGLNGYYTIGNALTAGQNTLTLTITPLETDRRPIVIHAWINRVERLDLTARGDGAFTLTTDVSALGPGEHEILLAAAGEDTAFARLTFHRTHPLYVVVSSDWDDADNSDVSLELQEELRNRHPDLVLTHFLGPYTFTDPALSEERRTSLAAWAARMRDTFGDEIGVHLHPWCHFIETTGVPCRTAPSTVERAGDRTGYSVIVASYSEEESIAILDASRRIFAARGLGTPTSFRAGGWTAGVNTVRALAATGFTVDSSATSWARLEAEWAGYDLYAWNMTHWAPIGDTSQPWYPSAANLLADTAPQVPVLEVPDNGILVDYITAGEMIDVFTRNWAGRPGALTEPRQLSIGYHPTTIVQSDFEARLDTALSHIDRYQAKDGAGPVVYARLSDLTKVWPFSTRVTVTPGTRHRGQPSAASASE